MPKIKKHTVRNSMCEELQMFVGGTDIGKAIRDALLTKEPEVVSGGDAASSSAAGMPAGSGS